MSQKIELLRCLFCNGEARLLHEGPAVQSYIVCAKCFARTNKFQISTDHSCDEEAIKAWNRRADNAKPMVMEEG